MSCEHEWVDGVLETDHEVCTLCGHRRRKRRADEEESAIETLLDAGAGLIDMFGSGTSDDDDGSGFGGGDSGGGGASGDC